MDNEDLKKIIENQNETHRLLIGGFCFLIIFSILIGYFLLTEINELQELIKSK